MLLAIRSRSRISSAVKHALYGRAFHPLGCAFPGWPPPRDLCLEYDRQYVDDRKLLKVFLCPVIIARVEGNTALGYVLALAHRVQIAGSLTLGQERFWLAWPMALCSVLTENCTRPSLAVSVYFSDLPTS